MNRLGSEEAFRTLLEQRQAADYAPAGHAIPPHEALALLGIAKEAIRSLEDLAADERRRLAVILLAKSRPRQARRS